MAAINLQVGADTVIFGFSIPSDSVVTSMRGKAHFIGEEINWKKAAIYGMDAYLMGLDDPDSTDTYNALWDKFVPKAIGWANGGLELDTVSQQTTPFFEPGEATVEDILDLGDIPERVFQHRGFRTIVNNPVGYNFVASDASTYFPAAEVMIDVKKKYRVPQRESVLLFACASPLLTDVTVTSKSTVQTETWAYLKYAGTFLKEAFIALIGDIEAGAESPYENVMNDLEEELLPAILEVTAGDFDDMVYKVFGMLNVQVTVKGEFDISSLSLKS